MLVSCRYCNKVHDRKYKCEKAPKRYGKKETNDITRFRNTSAWKKKRIEIKKRDKYLCQLCLLEGKYTFDNLDVHHILPISKAWDKRLDCINLITLCKYHHFHCDNNDIDESVLYAITINKTL
jgi:5-methylcytosine-specific restriction enzyme A